MSPDEAAWVRTHAWTPAMRAGHGPWTHRCACQHGPTEACTTGAHDHCPKGHPAACYAPTPETHIRDADGRAVTTPRGAVIGIPAAEAAVWVTGCCSVWTCPCACHTAPPAPRQLALLETA